MESLEDDVLAPVIGHRPVYFLNVTVAVQVGQKLFGALTGLHLSVVKLLDVRAVARILNLHRNIHPTRM